MFGDLLNTPTQNKYRGSQWSNRKDKSMTFSHLNKSYSNHKSTEIGQNSPFQSGAVSRLEQAKRTIDSVIVDIEDQKDVNQSAFRQVRGVNAQVLEEFKRGFYNEKENNTSTFCPDYKSQSASIYQMKAPQEDSVMLRNMLNQEMKKNSVLLLQMSRLDEQNRMLKEQGYGGGYEMREMQMENEKLRRALSQVSNLPQQIFSQLDELKRENQSLRKDTVKLLRKTERMV